jgi:hypothetical protein
MKNIIIENSIFNEDNLTELNHFLTICTITKNEKELRDELRNLKEHGAFEHLEEKGIRYGFGKNHFWMSERQYRNEWERILFIDFTNKTNN